MSAYYPVIKLKTNDVQALNVIPRTLISDISPIFEMVRAPSEGSVEKHLVKALNALDSYKQSTIPIVDLTLFKPGTSLHGRPAAIAGFDNLKERGRQVVPVVSNALEEELWRHLPEVVAQHGKGACFRLFLEDILAPPEQTTGWLSGRLEALGVSPTSTDLILDCGKLGAVNNEDIIIATVALLRAIDKVGLVFRSLIMSGSSLVDYVTEVVEDEHSEGDIFRAELGNWLRTCSLYGWRKSIYFSDYGIVRPGHIDNISVPGLNGKVRYTWGRRTTYFRGCSRMKTKLRDQYPAIARRVVNSKAYKGCDFSAGDKFLHSVVHNGRRSACMGEWIRVDMNHHLVYVARQTRALLGMAAQGNRSIETLEQFAETF